MNKAEILIAVLSKLKEVIDPETGVDVIRMQLVQDLTLDDDGNLTYTFRPSSPLCPIAIHLAMSIQEAIKEVHGIASQRVNVVDYIQADMLNEILNTPPGKE